MFWRGGDLIILISGSSYLEWKVTGRGKGKVIGELTCELTKCALTNLFWKKIQENWMDLLANFKNHDLKIMKLAVSQISEVD
jgi:hypothetical protein